MDGDIVSEFYSLAKEAKESPDFGCYSRAKRLLDIINKSTTAEVFILGFRPVLDGDRIKLKKNGTPWRHHYTVLWRGVIFDPSYGIPIPADEYLGVLCMETSKGETASISETEIELFQVH